MKRLKLYLIIAIAMLLSGCTATSAQVEQKLGEVAAETDSLTKAYVKSIRIMP